MEEDWEDLSEQRKIELAGYKFFQRYGDEDWAAYNSLYSIGNDLMYEDHVIESDNISNEEEDYD